MGDAPTVALFVSGHGFGHAVRSAEVARALIARGAQVHVRTEAPLWLFPAEVHSLASPGWPVDVGVAQRDGLEMDLERTRGQWDAAAADFEQCAAAEARTLRGVGANVVIGDIPPLAFAAAAKSGIPSVAVANFGWDWIYAEWSGFGRAVEAVRSGYRKADVLLRLPLHSDDPSAFCAFRTIEDVPLVARTATRSRAEVRRAYALPAESPTVLLSFGGFDAAGLDYTALGRRPDFTFVLTPPLRAPADLPANVRVLPRDATTDYVSLLAACDAVVTKPGYGIVADSLANQVPVLFTERGPFAEYPVLAQALMNLGQAAHIPREDLLRGQIGPHLDRLLRLPGQWAPLDLSGPEVIADRVLEVARVACDG